MDLAVNLVAISVLAIVASGGYHDYSSINQRARCATDWIVLVRTDGSRAETHVDDADGVLVLVQRIGRARGFAWIGWRKNPIKRTQQIRRGAHAVLIEHAQVNNAGARCDSLIRVSGCANAG